MVETEQGNGDASQIIDFNAAWQLYTTDVKDSGKRILISLFEKIKPVFDDAHNFTLVVPNKVVADRLEDERPEMLIFLRKKTGNTAINLIVDIQQQKTEAAPYTNREKYDSLAQKNPKLIDLKNALDLEVE